VLGKTGGRVVRVGRGEGFLGGLRGVWFSGEGGDLWTLLGVE